MMTKPEAIREYIATEWAELTEDDKRFTTVLEADSKTLADQVDGLLSLHEEMNELSVEFNAHMILDQNVVLTVSLTPSLRAISVDTLSVRAREDISDAVRFDSVELLLSVVDRGSIHRPQKWANSLRNDSSQLSGLGVEWRVVTSISKKPIEDFVKERWESAGINAEVLTFVSLDGLLQYMKSSRHTEIASRSLNGSGKLILAVGELEYTGASRHLIVTDIWLTDEEAKAEVIRLGPLEEMHERHRFFSQVVSANLQEGAVIPDLFEVDFDETRDDLNAVKDLFQSLEMLHALLALASYRANTGDWNSWNIKFIGAKTIEGVVVFEDGEVKAEGRHVEDIFKPVIDFYHWTFDDMNAAKVSMSRKTIALNSSSVPDFLNNVESVRKSAEAAFNLYIEQAVSAILETRQKFMEFLQDWTGKDIDLKLSLNQVIYSATCGGFGAILGALVGVVTQPLSPATANLILISFPILFVLYLVLSITRISQLTGVFQSYLEQHMRSIAYYGTVLGEDTVKAIAGIVSKDEIEKEFMDKRFTNLIVMAIMIVLSLVSLFLLWYFGYIEI
jgi:hypothetical protein